MEQIQILNNGDTLNAIRNKINENFALVDNKASSGSYIRFTANSGNETDGVADLLTRSEDATYLTFKVGGEYPNLIVTNGAGVSTEVSSLNPLYFQGLATGTYTVVVNGSETQAVRTTFYYQIIAPNEVVNGNIWFNGNGAYEYQDGQWVDYPYTPIGEVLFRTDKIAVSTTYPYNSNGLEQGTTSSFGLLRTAAVVDELNCHCLDAVLTPANLYSLNNYRTMNTEYQVDDKVGCPYHHNLQLTCVQAGVTSNEALDTKVLEAGTTIEDGTVTWEVVELGEGSLENKITNCILEVPQNIKLELADGVLTLKAGSKVTIPNGVGVFEEVVIQTDVSGTHTGNLGASFVYYRKATNDLVFSTVSATGSGTTPPSSDAVYYNTSTNTINNINSSGVITDIRSLPLAIVQRTGSISSIDLVFNGIGFIGSTIFANKGIKGLIPNGRNEDGTLNNIEFETQSVLTQTRNIGGKNMPIILNNVFVSNYAVANYDENANMVFVSNGTQIKCAIVGTWSADNTGKFTEINVKKPFRAVDYQENKKELATKLNKTQISNCLLEVPQNIKLELNNDTLTLKAGSKAYVPNGVGVFKEVNITANKTLTTGGVVGDKFIFVDIAGNFQAVVSVNTCYSGNEQPETGLYQLWYDTTNNIIKRDMNKEGVWTVANTSLPLGIIKSGGTTITDLKQVFNGFGFIGSTIFADKGIKGLISNGRNADGTLNNNEFETKTVLTRTITNNGSVDAWITLNANNVAVYTKTSNRYFDEDKNYFMNGNSPLDIIVAGDVKTVNGIITEFKPKNAFRAVEKYDITSLLSINNGFKTIGSNYVAFYSDEAKTTRTLLIQWGVVSNQTANPYTLTFPQAWTNKNYSIVATDWEGSGTYAISFDYGNRTATSCNVHFNINAGRGFGWIAIGK